MHKKVSKVYIVAPIILLVVACAWFLNNNNNITKAPSDKNYSINERMEMTINYFVNNQRSNGYFLYGYDFLNGRQSKSDSVVYQSYAGYVLVNYFSYVTADKNTDKYVFIKDAISNLLKAFEASTINYKDCKIVSFVAKTANSRESIAKELGDTDFNKLVEADSSNDIMLNSIVSTVFAYITESKYREITGDTSFENLGKEWFNTIDAYALNSFSQYKKNGKFEIPEEVLLAISLNLDKKPEYSDMIKEAWSDKVYDARYEKGSLKLWFDATTLHNARQYTKNKYFADALKKETTLYINEVYPEIMPEYNSCMYWYAFSLVSGYVNPQDDAELYVKLVNRLQLEKDQNLRFQILPQQTEFVVSGERKFSSKDFASFSGAFIDTSINLQTTLPYTQFCMLAMIEDAMLYNKDSKK